VAVLWAVWHLPDFFAEEGFGLEESVLALVFLAYEIVALFFARVVIVWLYARTAQSVLLVVLWHASFDASVSELSRDIIPGSDAARLAIFTAVVVLIAVAIIAATRGRLGMATRPGAPRPRD
jgi:hypothetical protein